MKYLLLLFTVLFSSITLAEQALPLPPAPAIAARAYLLADFSSGRLLVQQGVNDRISKVERQEVKVDDVECSFRGAPHHYKNKAYLGIRAIHKRDKANYEEVGAAWEPIVEEPLFGQVQALLGHGSGAHRGWRDLGAPGTRTP